MAILSPAMRRERMKVIILGAGQVGASVAEGLVSKKTTSRSSIATGHA
jgi:saccharopine dehydrogenase-like NADP-dependent oxidoreductase